VARILWRQALKNTPEESKKELNDDPANTIWVMPWEKMQRLSIPSGMATVQTVVLHTLLIHNGLPFDVLADLLPQTPVPAEQCAHLFADKGLAECNRGIWRVSASGYPAVRQFLNGEGYLVDDF